MKLNRLVGLVLVGALLRTSIPIRAEEREGVLVPTPVLTARLLDARVTAYSDRQLVQVPSPVTRMPGVRPGLKALMWTALGIGTALAGTLTFVYATGLNRS